MIANYNQEQIDALVHSIENANICVLYQTPNLVYQWTKNLPPQLAPLWRPFCTDSDLFDPQISSQIIAIKKAVLHSGLGNVYEARLGDSAQPIWIKFSIDCHRDIKGGIIGLITTGVNVTELRQREQILKVLLSEVSHRSKNLLAIMQSIAVQTARFSGSVDEFLKKYQGRIQSLSQSQDLVTDSNWRGALFKELITAQASNYIEPSDDHFIIKGENPYLFPSAALHIGLAFHELIINSSSYGALASEKGKVTIHCTLKMNENGSSFIQMTWHETFDHPSELKQNHARFGSTVLERIVPAAVDGSATYQIEDDTIKYLLNVPSSNYDL